MVGGRVSARLRSSPVNEHRGEEQDGTKKKGAEVAAVHRFAFLAVECFRSSLPIRRHEPDGAYPTAEECSDGKPCLLG